MTVGVVKETQPEERRVALVPGAVKPLIRAGMDVVVETMAGAPSFYDDGAYQECGARIVDRETAASADIVARVAPPTDAEIGQLRMSGVLLGFLGPLDEPGICSRLAAQGVTALSMELVPRTSRAQKMDALSAMASLAGYKAVLLAAVALPKFYPLLTTAAGTVRPATVLVLGAGVAGLQAIATARRLGARVWGYDIRDSVREEVQSLGAQFVELDLEIGDMQDAGGYAQALMAEKAQHQMELLAPHIGQADVVITTAQIPGREAPILVTQEAVEVMQPGSVIVDVAAPTGGNCALTAPGETVVHRGVQILGPRNLPATMPVHASQLYARTVRNMIEEFVADGQFIADFDDEIFRGACVTHAGQVVHDRIKSLLVA